MKTEYIALDPLRFKLSSTPENLDAEENPDDKINWILDKFLMSVFRELMIQTAVELMTHSFDNPMEITLELNLTLQFKS